LKRSHVEVVERRDFDDGVTGKLMALRQQLNVDLIVVHPQASFLDRKRRPVCGQTKKQAKSKNSR
jgi:hypothetical protein